MQATFIDNHSKNGNICQLSHIIQTIIHRIIVFIEASNIMHINSKLLNSLTREVPQVSTRFRAHLLAISRPQYHSSNPKWIRAHGLVIENCRHSLDCREDHMKNK